MHSDDHVNRIMADAHWPRHVMRAPDYGPLVMLAAYRRALTEAIDARRRRARRSVVRIGRARVQMGA
jgi:hypothetical protein